jgi:hypothetical protein
MNKLSLEEIVKLLEDSVKNYDSRASFSPHATIQASIEYLRKHLTTKA